MNSWSTTTLKQLVEIKYGDSLPERLRTVGGTVPVFGSNGVVGRHDKAITRAPVIIIGRKGSVGAVNFSSEPCWPIDTAYYIDDFPNQLSPDWTFLFLRTQDLAHLKQDGPKAGIRRDDIYEIEIPIPPSAEQRRLVARIESLTGRLEQARHARRAALAEAETILRSTRRAAYEAMLDAHESIPLAKVGDVLSGGTPSKAESEFWGGDIPWIAPKEMKAFRLADSSLRITQQAINAGAAKLVSELAVLMVVRGMILARAVPVAIGSPPLAINQDMKAFLPRNGHDVTFLAHMLAGAEDELLGRVEVAGHGTCKLESEAWGSLPVPRPPRSIQDEVVRKLDAVAVKADELRRLQREVDVELAAFVPALLAKAFRGEL